MSSTRSRNRLLAVAAVGLGLTTAGLIGLSPANARIGSVPTGHADWHFRFTQFHDANGNGTFDEGETLISDGQHLGYSGVGDNNWANDTSKDPAANTGASVTDWPRFEAPGNLYHSATGQMVAYDEGPFSFAINAGAPNNTGCTPAGDWYPLVDGEPYDDSLTDDPEFAVTHPDLLREGGKVFVALDGQQFDFYQPFDCDFASVTGNAFIDSNENGVRDEGESPVAGVGVALDGVSPIVWDPQHYTFGNTQTEDFAALVDDQLQYGVLAGSTGEDGAFSFAEVSQLRTYDLTVEDPEGLIPQAYWVVADVPAECSIVPQNGWEALGSDGPIWSARAALPASVNAGADGFWEGAGYARDAGDGLARVDISWGDEAAIDIPLACAEVPPPETTTTTTTSPPETTTTTVAVTTTTAAPAPTTTQPTSSGGGVVVNTGSGGASAAAVASTLIGMVMVTGSGLVAVALRRLR